MAEGGLMERSARRLGLAVVASLLTLRPAVSLAQDLPTPEMFRVLGEPEEGPRITPYLRFQLDRAWEQDDLRRAAFAKVKTESDLLALRKEIRARVLDII